MRQRLLVERMILFGRTQEPEVRQQDAIRRKSVW
jgi:hypothetical protein